MLRLLSEGEMSGLDGMSFYVCAGEVSSMGIFPGCKVGCDIVFDMFDGPAPFEKQRLEPAFTEFFGGPAPGDAGTYDDGIEAEVIPSHTFSFYQVPLYGICYIYYRFPFFNSATAWSTARAVKAI